MLQAMFSGVSGLQAHQTRLDVIGNNIANVNTIGFKAGSVTFEDQLSQTLRAAASPTATSGGENPAQVGLGVTLGTVDTLQTQGDLQTTGKNTDMAIQGDGFFLVGNGNNVDYTRDGSFDLDSSGVLVNPSTGNKLLGYVADTNGNVDTTKQIGADSVINIPVGTLTSVKQTTTSTFQGNLSASSSLQSTNVTLTGQLDTSGVPNEIDSTVYDSGGNAHPVQITFSNPTLVAGVSTWTVNATVDGVSVTSPPATLQSTGSATAPFFKFTPSGATALTANVNGTGGALGFQLKLDFSGLTDKSTVTNTTNGQATPPIASTQFSLNGDLNLDTAAAAANNPYNATVYDSTGTAHNLAVTLSTPTLNPTGAGVPAGATASYNIKIQTPNTLGATLYDSTAGQSKIYYVPGSGFVTADTAAGTSLGSSILLNGVAAGANNQGQQVAAGFGVTFDLSKLTTTTTSVTADGQAGPPSNTWSTSLTAYDSLGVQHQVVFTYKRADVGTGAPAAATARWDWTATEGTNVLTSSSSPGNSALFFDNQGNLLDKNKQTVPVSPKSGAAPFSVSVDFSALTQLADQTSSVTATSQDGFAVGTLQTFSIAQNGIITGVFSNGQSRTLGQVATATFSNPAGLAKLGDNLFTESNNSGLAQVGQPTQAGRGQISTGFVEMSNVDLSSEFTNLIITERGFQANTRIISVVDDMLQDVINLKQ